MQTQKTTFPQQKLLTDDLLRTVRAWLRRTDRVEFAEPLITLITSVANTQRLQEAVMLYDLATRFNKDDETTGADAAIRPPTKFNHSYGYCKTIDDCRLALKGLKMEIGYCSIITL